MQASQCIGQVRDNEPPPRDDDNMDSTNALISNISSGSVNNTNVWNALFHSTSTSSEISNVTSATIDTDIVSSYTQHNPAVTTSLDDSFLFTLLNYSDLSNSSLFNHTEPEHTVAEIVIISILVSILSVATAGGNLLVIIAFKLDKQLQTITNYFLLSLAVADFAIGIISMPLCSVYLLMGYWPLGTILCDSWLSLDYTMSNASVANLLLICFDRYYSITRPLTYRANRTPKKVGVMIGCAWAISAILWTPWIFAWPHIEGERTVPDTECYIQFLETNAFITIVTACAAFFLPVTIMTILYYRIFMETEKRQKRIPMLQASKDSEGSRKSMASSDDDMIYCNRRSDSSPDFDGMFDMVDSDQRGQKSFWSRYNCCRIDREVDYNDDSSTSDPPGSPIGNINAQDTARNIIPPCKGVGSSFLRSVPNATNLQLNGRFMNKNNHSNLAIPLIAVEPTSASTTPVTPCTDITGTSSRHSNLSSVVDDCVDAMIDKDESMYTILIRLPRDDSVESDGKPSIKMMSDIETDDELKLTLTSNNDVDSDSSDQEQHVRIHESSFIRSDSRRNRGPPLPPPTGTPALGRRTHAADSARAAMQAKLAAKVARKVKNQRARRKRQERKQDKKAAKTLSAILFAFIITWTPYNIFAVVHAFCEGCIDPLLYDIGEYLSK